MPHRKEPGSVGLIKKKYYTFAEPPHEMPLDCGAKLGPITLAYETYGKLNRDRSNAILILHALSGDSHAAGRYAETDKHAGWWDNTIGPGKAFDTDKYFILCSNVIGGCQGSTGPASINPATGREYGLSFPMITVHDMVRAQVQLVDHLGIDRLLAVAGGSMGGMQALRWAVSYPERVISSIPIATTSKLSPQGIAFNEVGRVAIMKDPHFQDGDYYGKELPRNGLSLARMVGHITYLSDDSMHEKFGRRLRGKKSFGFDFNVDFEVESYLRHKGGAFVDRFDSNSYLYITKAIDYFDLSMPSGSLVEEVRKATAKFLIISFKSDWLYPPYQSREIVKALMVGGVDVTYCEIDSRYGHDAFLLDEGEMSKIITSFLANVASKAGVAAGASA
ncbi:MAG TPA: homoserine O-acetyltransferase [Candidatus Deferrimicrobiaceae bacterium]|nr:homoserine O-acetyltransferase [Candidatus Deferrimicrobiaceae bacterium]